MQLTNVARWADAWHNTMVHQKAINFLQGCQKSPAAELSVVLQDLTKTVVLECSGLVSETYGPNTLEHNVIHSPPPTLNPSSLVY